MRLKEGTYLLEFNKEELWYISCSLQRCMTRSARDHWINHFEGDNATRFAYYVIENEKHIFDIAESMRNLCDHKDFKENLIHLLEDIYKEHQKGE